MIKLRDSLPLIESRGGKISVNRCLLAHLCKNKVPQLELISQVSVTLAASSSWRAGSAAGVVLSFTAVVFKSDEHAM